LLIKGGIEMAESLIKFRVFRQPKAKLTNPMETGDWKLGIQSGGSPEKTSFLALNKDKTLKEPGKISVLIGGDALKAITKKPKKASGFSGPISKRVFALWPGEIPEGLRTWLSVDFLKADDGSVSCIIKDEFSGESEETAITQEHPLQKVIDKTIEMIVALVKRPVVDPKQSEMFAPIPSTPTPPLAVVPQTQPPPASPPKEPPKQLDIFSDRDYRQEIRVAATKKTNPD
jgi:hypothetical protein